MTEANWLQVVIEGGILIAAIKGVMLLGRTLQKIEDHNERIERLERKVFG